ncbi:hypothetical protein [Bacillus sp. GB_SG_008]|uniref:hypothetical protein n=1 Tax=Bacillus sp. GB_SG_008 TaxID=3454627 RepID=UPI003F82AFFE
MSSLVKKGFILDDFLNSTEKMVDLQKMKPKLCSDIKKVMHKIGSQEKEDNLYQLYNEGLSLGIIGNLIEAGVSYHEVPELLVNGSAHSKISLRHSTLNKIIEAFNVVEKNKGSVSYHELLSYADNYVSDLTFNQSITISQFRDILFRKFQIPIGDSLNRIITDLQKARKIKFTSIGIKKNVFTLMEYLQDDFEDKELLLERLEGETFQQLADQFGYSRQGAINVFKRVIAKMPIFEEEYRFAALFEEYDVEETLFCKLFDESPIVYQFLIHKFNRQSKSILEGFYHLNFNDKQRECLLQYFNCFISTNGEILEYTRFNVFNEVLKKYHYEKMRNEDILVRYNDYLVKNNFPENLKADINSIRGIVERSDYIIRCKSHYFRYYDFQVIDGQILKRLNDLLMLERGVYSTKKLFSGNPELMEELDIRTEYELHNLLKRHIHPPQVKYTRMPEFTIGKITKKEFMLESFYELAPIEFSEFLEYIEENFGLRRDSLASYIISELSQYIHNEYIKVDYQLLSKDKIQELKTYLSEPIYTVEQFKSIGLNVDKHFNKYVNNMNLINIGYTLRSNYVLSNEYSSVEEYFRAHILSQDYFVYEDLSIYKNQSYTSAISKLEKSFDIIKVEKDMYITSKKLGAAGISHGDIMDYREKLLELVQHNEFFTLKRLRDLGFEHFIEDFGFEDIFYERMISRFEGISTIRLGVGYVFKLSEEQISLSDFIYHLVAAHRKLNLYDLLQELQNQFGLDIETYKIISSIQNVEIFYSEELQRFYLDAEDYYEEVFS